MAIPSEWAAPPAEWAGLPVSPTLPYLRVSKVCLMLPVLVQALVLYFTGAGTNTCIILYRGQYKHVFYFAGAGTSTCIVLYRGQYKLPPVALIDLRDAVINSKFSKIYLRHPLTTKPCCCWQALVFCTLVSSTMNLSMRFLRFANSAAPEGRMIYPIIIILFFQIIDTWLAVQGRNSEAALLSYKVSVELLLCVSSQIIVQLPNE